MGAGLGQARGRRDRDGGGQEVHNRHATAGRAGSWSRSLPALAHLVVGAGLHDGHRPLVVGPLVPKAPLPLAARLVPLQLAALPLLNALFLRVGGQRRWHAGA